MANSISPIPEMAPEMPDHVEELHKALVADGATNMTLDKFRDKMKDKSKRKQLYDALRKDGVTNMSEKDFDAKLLGGNSDEPVPTPRTAVKSAPATGASTMPGGSTAGTGTAAGTTPTAPKTGTTKPGSVTTTATVEQQKPKLGTADLMGDYDPNKVMQGAKGAMTLGEMGGVAPKTKTSGSGAGGVKTPVAATPGPTVEKTADPDSNIYNYMGGRAPKSRVYADRIYLGNAGQLANNMYDANPYHNLFAAAKSKGYNPTIDCSGMSRDEVRAAFDKAVVDFNNGPKTQEDKYQLAVNLSYLTNEAAARDAGFKNLSEMQANPGKRDYALYKDSFNASQLAKYDHMGSGALNLGANPIYESATWDRITKSIERDIAAGKPKDTDSYISEGLAMNMDAFEAYILNWARKSNRSYNEIFNEVLADMRDAVYNGNKKWELLDEKKAMADYYSSELDRMDSRVNEGFAGLDTKPGSAYGGVFDTWELGYDPDRQALVAASALLREARQGINESQMGGGNTLASFTNASVRGAWDKLQDPDMYTMGAYGMTNNGTLMNVCDKHAKGLKLSKAEQTLLDAFALKSACEVFYNQYIGSGYRAGMNAAEAMEFILEMFVGGKAVDATNAGIKALAKGGKNVLKKWLKRLGMDEIIERGLSRLSKAAGKMTRSLVGTAGRAGEKQALEQGGRSLAQQAAEYGAKAVKGGAKAAYEGGIMTASVGMPSVLSNTWSRSIGDAKYNTDDEGHITFEKTTGGKGLGQSFREAFTDEAIQYGSEMLGSYVLDDLLGWLNRVGKNIGAATMDKVGLKGLRMAYKDIQGGTMYKAIQDFRKYVHYDGSLGEYLEEVSANILNAALVGDMNFNNPDDPNSVYNWKTNWETYVSCQYMGVLFGMANATSYRTPRRRAESDIENADHIARAAFGNSVVYGNHDWPTLADMIRKGDDSQVEELMLNIAKSDKLSESQRRAAINYAGAVTRLKAIEDGEEADNKIAEEDKELREIYSRGYSMENLESLSDAKASYDTSRTQVEELLDDAALAEIDNDPGKVCAWVRSNQKLDEETRQAVLNYISAKMQYEGAEQRMNDDESAAIEASNLKMERRIKSRAKGGDDMIHPVRLRNGGKLVFVIDGNVVGKDDGSVDASGSDKDIYIIDEDGNVSMTSADMIESVEELQNPAEVKAAAESTIREAYASMRGEEAAPGGNVNEDGGTEGADASAAPGASENVNDGGTDGSTTVDEEGEIEIPNFQKEDLITIEIDGKKIRGQVTHGVDDNGNVEIMLETAVGKNGHFMELKPEELTNMLVSYNPVGSNANTNILDSDEEGSAVDDSETVTGNGETEGADASSTSSTSDTNSVSTDEASTTGATATPTAATTTTTGDAGNNSDVGNQYPKTITDATGNQVVVNNEQEEAEAMKPAEEVRDEKSEVRSQKTEVRDEKSEIRDQKSEDTQTQGQEQNQTQTQTQVPQQQSQVQDTQTQGQETQTQQQGQTTQAQNTETQQTQEAQTPGNVELTEEQKAAAYVDAYFPGLQGGAREARIQETMGSDFENRVQLDKEDGVNQEKTEAYDRAIAAASAAPVSSGNVIEDRGTGAAATAERPSLPLLDDGNADFSNATPREAHDYIYNDPELDEDEANQVVQAHAQIANEQLEQAKATLEQAEAVPAPIMKDYGTDVAGYKRAKNQRNEAIAQANAAVAAAQRGVDLWNGVQANHMMARANEAAAASGTVTGNRGTEAAPGGAPTTGTVNGEDSDIMMSTSGGRGGRQRGRTRTLRGRDLRRSLEGRRPSNGSSRESSGERGASNEGAAMSSSNGNNTTESPRPRRRATSEADKRIDEMRRAWLLDRAMEMQEQSGIPVHVMESLDDVPAEYYDDVVDQLRSGQRVYGFFAKGEAYLYMPDIYREGLNRLEKTFMHEAVSHAGLRALFQNTKHGIKTFNDLCDQVFDSMSDTDKEIYINYYRATHPGKASSKKGLLKMSEVEDIKKETTEEERRGAADEYMAHMPMRRDIEQSRRQKVVSAIRNALRKVFGAKMSLTDNDIVSLLNESKKNMMDMAVAKNEPDADKALSAKVDAGMSGAVEGANEDASPVHFSTSAIAEGAGLKAIEDDGHGNVAMTVGDKVFTGHNPISVEDIKSAKNAPINLIIEDARALKTVSEEQIEKIYEDYANMLNRMLEKGLAENGGFMNLAGQWRWIAETAFRTVHSNSDDQYGQSIDIATICKKNEAVINAISEKQVRQGFGVTPNQILHLYENTHAEGYQVPCPPCYVFSHYLTNGRHATIMINGWRKYGDRMADPSTLSEAEQKKRVKWWTKEYDKAVAWNKAHEKEISQAKTDIQHIENDIDKLSKKILGGRLSAEEEAQARKKVEALDKRYRAAVNLIAQSALDKWIKCFAINVKKDSSKNTLREDSWREIPDEMALDFDMTAESLRYNPGVQRLRSSDGSSGGKYIHQASNNEVGEVLSMLGLSDNSRDAVNPWLEASRATNEKDRKKWLKQARNRFKNAVKYMSMQSLRGGQRMWSWSDNNESLAPDVYMNLMQLQLLGGTLQSYSKQLEGINLVARMGGYVNGSLMGAGKGYRELSEAEVERTEEGLFVKDGDFVFETDEGETVTLKAPVYEMDGKYYTLEFDDVVGVSAFGKEDENGNHLKGLFELNHTLDKAGNILVGMNDMHNIIAMADPRIYFIIPYHKSGLSAHMLMSMYNLIGVEFIERHAQNYEGLQEDTFIGESEEVQEPLTELWENHKNEEDFDCGIEGGIPSDQGKLSEQQKEYRALRNAIFTDSTLDDDQARLDKIKADVFLRQVYDAVRGRSATGMMQTKDTESIYPYEYWDESSTIDNADVNGARYVEYCRRMGVRPKFSGMTQNGNVHDHGNFVDVPGYWKTLIDRRMYDTQGNYQGLDSVDTEGFDVDLVDPEVTATRFPVTRVADAEGTQKIVDRTEREENEMFGEPLSVNYDMTGDQAVKEYNQAVKEDENSEVIFSRNNLVDENSKEEIESMKKTVADFVSQDNLDKANAAIEGIEDKGLRHDAIFNTFDAIDPTLHAVNYIPEEFLKFIWGECQDNKVYCTVGHMIDHAITHHPEMDAEWYPETIEIVTNPDRIVETYRSLDNLGGKVVRSVSFVKDINEKRSAVVLSLEQDENGNKVLKHKTFFGKYSPANKKGRRIYKNEPNLWDKDNGENPNLATMQITMPDGTTTTFSSLDEANANRMGAKKITNNSLMGGGTIISTDATASPRSNRLSPANESLVQDGKGTTKNETTKENSEKNAEKAEKSSETTESGGGMMMSSSAIGEEEKAVLMGIHNITGEKLRSAIGLGGLANPSMAVVDTTKGLLNNFGEISLIPGHDLIDKKTGKNAGTFTADAYTPRFPTVHRRLGKGGEKKLNQWVKSLGMRPEMEYNTTEQFNDWVNGFDIQDNALVYPFLHEKGLSAAVDQEDHNEVSAPFREIVGRYHGDIVAMMDAFDTNEEVRQEITDIIIDDIVKQEAPREDGESWKDFRDRRRKWRQLVNDAYLDFAGFVDRGIARTTLEKECGRYSEGSRFNPEASRQAASLYIDKNGMRSEYTQWREQRFAELGVEQQMYAGSDREGRSKYKPITLESVSKAMKKQGLAGGESSFFSQGPGGVRARLTPRLTSLNQIRNERGRIQNDIDEILEGYSEELSDTARNMFANDREALAEVLTSSNMKAKAKELGFEISNATVQYLQDFKKRIIELPTEYFETKFERPVMLNEFEAAVVPNDVDSEIREALEAEGLDVREYDPEVAGDRERVTLEAAQESGEVMFSVSGIDAYDLYPNDVYRTERVRKDLAELQLRYNLPRIHLFDETVTVEDLMAIDTTNDSEAKKRKVAEEALALVINKKMKGYYSPDTKEIAIFAQNISRPIILELTLFHENFHGWVDHYSDKSRINILLDELYAQGENLHKELYDALNKDDGYTKEERPEEFMAYYMSEAMILGDLEEDVYRYLSKDNQRLVDNFLNDIGYERSEEEPRRHKRDQEVKRIKSSKTKTQGANNGEVARTDREANPGESGDETRRISFSTSAAVDALRDDERVYNDLLGKVFSGVSNETRRGIVADAMENRGNDFGAATEAWLTDLANDDFFAMVPREDWGKVKLLLHQTLMDNVVDVSTPMSDNEARYVLWKAGQIEDGVFSMAQDIVMQDRLHGSENRDRESGVMFSTDNDGIQFSTSMSDRAIARSRYERMVGNWRMQWSEAMQDSMLGLKKLMEAVMGDDYKHIEDIPMNQNAYVAENLMSSVIKSGQAAFYSEYMEPLIKEVSKLCKGKKKEIEAKRQKLTEYLLAKHGLERNVVFADRDAQETAEAGGNYQDAYAENRKRDYSGLTELTGKTDVAAAEAEAKKMVDEYESQHDTTELWKRIKAATDATLDKQYESDMISKASLDKIKNMFEFYVPLRGWAETTSDEVYGYLTSAAGPFLGGSIVKPANGRTTVADDPIANIAQMGDDSIQSGIRNKMKQCFLRFVMDHPSDLVSVNQLWLQHDDVSGEWKPVFANIPKDATGDQVKRIVEQFEKDIEELAEQQPDKYKRGRDAANIPYIVIPGMEREHQVMVKMLGQTYVLTINGNPKAAQALNGLTNPNVPVDGWQGTFFKYADKINRGLSALYTTLNPAFIVSNFLRDTVYSNNMVWVKEGPNYALNFNKNYFKTNPVMLRKLLGKWEKGSLDESKPMEKMFKLFMLHGGETGFAMAKDINDYKKKINKELGIPNSKYAWKRAVVRATPETMKKMGRVVADQYDLLGRSIENCARFAAFKTSVEMGRNVERAAYDAKEISVNFNKKGAGGRTVGLQGMTWMGNFGAFLSGVARSLFTFWNAGVQGMTNIGRAAKRHPHKAAMMLFMKNFFYGFFAPALAEVMGAMAGGDDEDKNAYYNLPEYVRRSNLCIWVGWAGKFLPESWTKYSDAWLTIPLPIEFRAIYGMGELTYSWMMGKERYNTDELVMKYAEQMSQVLPLDMLEGGGGWHAFTPTLAKPFVEAYWLNESWSGAPVYREDKYDDEKRMPEYTKVFSNTSQWLVDLAEWSNRITGGTDKTRGRWDWNPAKIEYLLKGYSGGLYSFPMDMLRFGMTATGNADFEWRNVPLANRVLKQGDERLEAKKLKSDYYKYKEEYEETKYKLKAFEEGGNSSLYDYAAKLDYLHHSKEYRHYLIFDDMDSAISSLRNAKKKTTDEGVKADYDAMELDVMREMVKMINDSDDGKAVDSNAALKRILMNVLDTATDKNLRDEASKELYKTHGATDRMSTSKAEYNQRYDALRSAQDRDEDAMLQKAKSNAKDLKDEELYKAYDKAGRELNALLKGVHTKKKNIKGMGEGDAENDKKIVEQYRKRRHEILNMSPEEVKKEFAPKKK